MSMKPRWQRTDSKENIIKNENKNFAIHCCIGVALFAILSCLLVPYINGWGVLIGSLGFGLPFGICYLRRPKIGDEYSGYYSYEPTDDDSDSSLIGTLLGIVLIGGFIGVFCFFPRLFQFIGKEGDSDAK